MITEEITWSVERPMHDKWIKQTMARSADNVTRRRLFLKRSEVERLLGQTTSNDAIKAGWLKPKVTKKGKKRENAMILFSAADVTAVEDRLNRGEYPGQSKNER